MKVFLFLYYTVYQHLKRHRPKPKEEAEDGAGLERAGGQDGGPATAGGQVDAKAVFGRDTGAAVDVILRKLLGIDTVGENVSHIRGLGEE